jgi:hypothetical protein
MLQTVNVVDGFSWDCINNTVPTTGYAVSAFKGRERIFDNAPTALEIAAFILDNADVLFSTKYVLGAHTKVVGCWQYEGRYYLDVSLIYSNRQTALQTGILNDQIAIWDIENCQEILCNSIQFSTFGE